MTTAKAQPAKSLLSPTNHALLLIDFQAQMAFATKSIDGVTLRNNATLIAKAAAEFKVPTVVTTIAEKTFSGPTFPEITQVFPRNKSIDRTSMNGWEDVSLIAEVNRIGKSRLVLAGLWTGVCIVGPALSAIEQGFEICVVTDACGDVSVEAHERAVQRMIQAGAQPMTAVQYLLELQRDWARTETYDETAAAAIAHAGDYGLGIHYAKAMFGAKEGQAASRASHG
jgi:nicotinamidase-related amidase